MSIWGWLFDGIGKKKPPASPLVSPFFISDKLIHLVKHYESFEPKAYWDYHGGVWTIGFGNTAYLDGRPVKKGDSIDVEQATDLLTKMLKSFMDSIERRNSATLEHNQVVALTSFLYNIGHGKKGVKDGLFELKRTGESSTLWRSTQRGEFAKAAEQFDLWVNAGGHRLKGLQRRRRAEKYIWQNKDMNAASAIALALKDFP